MNSVDVFGSHVTRIPMSVIFAAIVLSFCLALRERAENLFSLDTIIAFSCLLSSTFSIVTLSPTTTSFIAKHGMSSPLTFTKQVFV